MKLISSSGGSRASNKHAAPQRRSAASRPVQHSVRRDDTQDLPPVPQTSAGAYPESNRQTMPRPSAFANTASPIRTDAAGSTYENRSSEYNMRIIRDPAYAQPPIAEPDSPPVIPIDEAAEEKRKNKRRRRKRRLLGWGITLVTLVALYFFCVYTRIPFIANLRSLYIETAMTTMEHQWLATYFIPMPVIRETMEKLDHLEQQQDSMQSDWSGYSKVDSTKLPDIQKTDDSDTQDNPNQPDEVKPPEFWEDPEHEFWDVYSEIDYDSFHAYALEHGESMYNTDGYLFIDEADAGSDGTGIVTTNGDPVLGIDAQNGIVMVRLKGFEYEGVMAIVKDPKQVGIGIASHLGSYGSKISEIAQENEAILAINASGFEDDGGHGNGGTVYGLLYAEGVKYKGSAGGTYKAIYFDSNYRLNVRAYESGLDIYNGVEFKPALVINGEAALSGSAGWGIQPRCAIGQTEDGSVLMIVIDGRQTHSVGITVGDLANIFVSYGAVQAGNLDGGSSAVMYYNGRIITKPSGADKVNGRHLPDAFIVKARSAIADGSDV